MDGFVVKVCLRRTQRKLLSNINPFVESIMLVLRNLQSINTLIILGGLALCLVFMIQVKQIYNKNQKYNRYLGYKQYMTEISSEMSNAEKTVNKSATYVRQLSEALTRHEKDAKNASSQRVISSN